MSFQLPGSALKITADGDQVLSDYLDPGERLVNGTTYEQLVEGFQAGADLPERTIAPLTPGSADDIKLGTDPTGVNTQLQHADGTPVLRLLPFELAAAEAEARAVVEQQQSPAPARRGRPPKSAAVDSEPVQDTDKPES